ncbi:MAG: phosphatase PAP2 family protein [Candidatus Heimdallarchaeota archaeon]
MEIKGISNRLDEWDQKIIIKYNNFGGKYTTYILKIISFFGRETLWISLIVFFLFIWYDPFILSNLSAIFLTGLILVITIKFIVNRSRPFDKIEEGKLVILERKPSSKSFPSWHAYNIVSYGLLFGLYFLHSPLITTLMQILAVLVCFSRIQLGVHYPSDVIMGYIIGVIGFLISIYFIGPLLQIMIVYFEQFAIHEIEYQQWNSMLFEQGWYIFLCCMIYITIILLASYKMIKDYIKEGKIQN